MNTCNQKPCIEEEGFPLPDAIVVNDIFPKLELNSLCSLSCVSRNLLSLVAQALSTLPSLNLSEFSPSGQLLGYIVPKLRGVRSVTIDCLRLDDRPVVNILGPHILELNLLKCASLSYDILASIRIKCPNLRILNLELAWESSPEILKQKLVKALQGFLCLECLSIKVRGTQHDAYNLACNDLFLPKPIKILKLQIVDDHGAHQLIEKLRDEREYQWNLISRNISSYLGYNGFTLQRLSLVLNVICDRVITSITSSLPLLVELDLEDRPWAEPKLPRDLTNSGLESLGSCRFLTSLSIVRSRVSYSGSFKRINDLGIFLLSASCEGLEFVRLGGFSIVTDAGFSSLLRSCSNLKKFEIRNAPLLSDLAFHNIIGVVCPLVELKLLSCNLITSEALTEFASSNTLELLDTNGCRSIADPCLDYISCLNSLKSLNLGGADITDSGLYVLSKGNLPIVNLCLRGCTRVTDRGIISLFNDGERMKNTLTSLDIGHMPGVSDKAIDAIFSNCKAITELCVRCCFYVTDVSFKMLASGRSNGRSLLQKLDLSRCKRISNGVVELFERPLYRGLRWLGVGGTCLVNKRDDFAAIYSLRPWLTICYEGCEVGCHDGWQFHKSGVGLY
ncbi:hypothetical protein RD792_007498 [Penstemon davidsonii]|uniref:F-box/LRR-repeat protein 15-like leucin rich repeat domain-containing protein n=1 Tax=Penstemon davidsonii TaxID=160366 RepID=A0ABR0D6K9_9LAMI|nr:hypothetical protein RD792_007498 [Penstemon davidsonii]